MKKTVKISAILLAVVLAVGMLSACSLVPQSKQLIGKWVDTSKLEGGYEFAEDNKLIITYSDTGLNLPIIGQIVDGKIDGIYTTEKSGDANIVTLSYTMLNQSFSKKYEYSINGNILTLTDLESGKQTFYQRAETVKTSSPVTE